MMKKWMWLFVLSLCAILMLPELLKEGMYYDGMVYSLIARNMAFGYGSFWEPMFTPSVWPIFYEHPPGAFGLQSLFFRVFGNGFYVERLFALFTFVFSAFLIVKLWKTFGEEKHQNLAWLPVLCWVIAPSVYNTYPRNMLESVVTCFALSAVYLALLHLRKEKHWTLLIAAGSLCTGAFLSKGFVGFFPWAVPFLYWLVFKNTSFIKMAANTVAIISSTLLLLFLLLQNETAYATISQYLDQQVFNGISGKRELALFGRFHILLKMGTEVFYMLLVLGLLWLATSWGKRSAIFSFVNQKLLAFWLLLWLAASLPVMISLKQFSYYVMPAYPFVAIAIAMLGTECWEQMRAHQTLKMRWLKIMKPLSIGLFLAALTAGGLSIGKSRDTAMLEDVKQLGQLAPNGTVFYNCLDSLYGDHRLQGYLFRYNFQVVSYQDSVDYLLLEHGKTPCESLTNSTYEELANLNHFRVFRKKEDF